MQTSRDSRYLITSKVLVLRAYLAALQEFSTPTLNVNSPVRGGVHGSGSRLGGLRSWLMPEVLLCLDRTDTVPLFLVTREGERVYATLDGLDAWLEAREQEIVQREISNSLRVLERSGSRLTNTSDKSVASKAVAQLRRVLLKDASA